MSNSKSNSKKSTNLNIRQRRTFSDEFKREKVKELISGQHSIPSFCNLWSVSKQTVYDWIYQYSPEHKKGTTMVIQKDSEATKTQELQRRIAELERSLGQKLMVIDYQDKLIELAFKEFEVDIKKNFKPAP